jgi:hypothetical protein
MIPFNPEQVLANARQATTEDLLDRVSVYRAGMEPQALAIFEEELRRRGVTPEMREEHARTRTTEPIVDETGVPAQCGVCRRPAIMQTWDWHRLWGKIPIFPRQVYYCEEHRPRANPS